MALLTVRYFQLIGLGTPELLTANAGPDHSGLTVEQLKDAGLATDRETLARAAYSVLRERMRRLAG